MKAALLLVDTQQDFLQESGLTPPVDRLVEETERLVEGCRALGVPVLHARTVVRADGSDAMPHWKHRDDLSCVEGSAGAEPPDALRARSDEPIFHKQFFSAFACPDLDAALGELGVETLVVAGVHLHGCVRATVLDAYQHGLSVWLARDAVGSTDPVHAEITARYLDGRAAELLGSDEILRRLGRRQGAVQSTRALPVAWISGSWVAGNGPAWQQHNPSHWQEVLASVPLGDTGTVTAAATAAAGAQAGWARAGAEERAGTLERWADRVQRRESSLVDLLTREIGKPLTESRDEVARGVELIRASARQLAGEGEVRVHAEGVRSLGRPVGVVGVVSPWNNPVAIPAGKLAAALAAGNAVVWKPAMEAPGSAMALCETLEEADLASGVVNLVFGDASTARRIIEEPRVVAATITGSVATGRSAAALCALLGKPLQAELGGNNAAVVLADCDLKAEAAGLARSAFSFAGQRCTATRRFIVEASILEDFRRELTDAIAGLQVGDPSDDATDVGPMISRRSRSRVQGVVQAAVAEGARILRGGDAPPDRPDGCWLEPTLLDSVRPDSFVALEETFGPLAITLPAADLEDAIRLTNAIPHGLVARLCSGDAEHWRTFCERVHTGIVQRGGGVLPVHPDAPFGGWKASGIGPPEHGVWDSRFYSRPQALYGP
jgi:alpha-ketoglutaric semialdehyde dehydrogenase